MGTWSRGICLGSRKRILFALLVAVGLGCRGEIGEPTPHGELALTITTTGQAPDTDGYRLRVDDTFVAQVGPLAEWMISLPAGYHTIQLDQLAENCQVGGDNPVEAFVTAGLRTSLALAVQCPGGGNLAVSTETVGSNLDPDGYLVTLNGEDRGSIGTQDQLVLEDVQAGAYSVVLRSVAPNCTVVDGNSLFIQIEEGQLAAVRFRVACLLVVPLDGEKLVIASQGITPGDRSHLYLIATDGRGRRQLTNQPADDYQPSFSPNGSLIAFGRNDGRDRLFIYDLARQQEASLRISGVPAGAWSPDGARLVVRARNGGLSISNLDGTGRVALTDGDDSNPYWAPDGSEIAFTRCSELCAAFAIRPDGSGLRRLGPDDGINRTAGPWSPDGTQILSESYRLDCSDYEYCGYADYDLSTINVSTGQTRLLTDTPGSWESSPVWAPDGDRIFYLADGDVFRLRLSGGSPTNLTNSLDWETWVSFGSPFPNAVTPRLRP